MTYHLKSGIISAIVLSSLTFPAFAGEDMNVNYVNTQSQHKAIQHIPVVAPKYRTNVSTNRVIVTTNTHSNHQIIRRVVQPVPTQKTYNYASSANNYSGLIASQNTDLGNTPVYFSSSKKIKNSMPVLMNKRAYQAR